jgi:CubicO group peptidase (beta-lactamase class C family)
MTFLSNKYSRSSVLAALFCAASVCCVTVSAEDRAENRFPGKEWQHAASLEAAGWSGDKLQAVDAYARSLPTTAYLVVQHGEIVHEYGGITHPANIYSMRKSVLSVLMGMHADRGEVDLDKTMAQLGIGDVGGLSQTEQQATVRELLQARSGVYHPAGYETAAMVALRPARGSHAPGEFWYYNNWDFNTLGGIFKKFTGNTVFEALRDDLATPLQFEDFDYARDTKFVADAASEYPAYVMMLSPRDLARVGLLMARSGKWRDQQLVSAKWVAESTTSYSTVTSRPPHVFGYGYLWWVGIDGGIFGAAFPGTIFAAHGNYGQRVVVVPALDLVIVHQIDTRAASGKQFTDIQFGELLKLIMAARASGNQ